MAKRRVVHLEQMNSHVNALWEEVSELLEDVEFVCQEADEVDSLRLLQRNLFLIARDAVTAGCALSTRVRIAESMAPLKKVHT